MYKKLLLTLIAGSTLLTAMPVSAQVIKVPGRQKTTWYHAPIEIQILDERPFVKDHREAPTAPQFLQLPPPPTGFGGGRGGGSGALAGDTPGGNGGGPIGIAGGGLPYRNFNPGYPIALPHADFGHALSNIPVGGIRGPAGLQQGYSSGIHGRTMSPVAASQPAIGRPISAGTQPHAIAAAPVLAKYEGGYMPGGGYTGSRGGATTSVTGTLAKPALVKMLHNQH